MRSGVDGSFSFFAVDATPETVATLRSLQKDESWLEIFGPHDLREDSAAFIKSFSYFNPLEISCFAKYVGARYILSRPGAANCCVFADADVMFFSDLREPLAALGDKAFLLTPHQTELSTDQAEHDYLQSGWINAGFFAICNSHTATKRILGWLINRITRRGFFAPSLGLYCDQSWLSQLPLAFNDDVAICSHPGMNVAYWNLPERKLTWHNGHFYVNGKPLVFFHFSGFNRFKHNRLSKHAGVSLDSGSPLAAICESYVEELAASDHLIPVLKNTKTIDCSRDDLQVRLDKGATSNGIVIGEANVDRGVFTKIGRRADAMFRHIMGR